MLPAGLGGGATLKLNAGGSASGFRQGRQNADASVVIDHADNLHAVQTIMEEEGDHQMLMSHDWERVFGSDATAAIDDAWIMSPDTVAADLPPVDFSLEVEAEELPAVLSHDGGSRRRASVTAGARPVEAAGGATAACPHCSRTVGQGESVNSRKNNSLGMWNSKLGYAGPPYCRACSESFRSHLLRHTDRPLARCSRATPCDACLRILLYFKCTPEQVFAQHDRAKRLRSSARAVGAQVEQQSVALVALSQSQSSSTGRQLVYEQSNLSSPDLGPSDEILSEPGLIQACPTVPKERHEVDGQLAGSSIGKRTRVWADERATTDVNSRMDERRVRPRNNVPQIAALATFLFLNVWQSAWQNCCRSNLITRDPGNFTAELELANRTTSWNLATTNTQPGNTISNNTQPGNTDAALYFIWLSLISLLNIIFGQATQWCTRSLLRKHEKQDKQSDLLRATASVVSPCRTRLSSDGELSPTTTMGKLACGEASMIFWSSSLGVALIIVSILFQLGFAFWNWGRHVTDKTLLVVNLVITVMCFASLVSGLRARDKHALTFWRHPSPQSNLWLWYCAIFGPTSILSAFSVNSLLSFGSVNCILSINSINCIGCVNSVSNVFSQEDRLPFDYGSP
eukprot:COSAG02_NODE_8843_length_2423_cov_1.361446_1_plen_628_part_00